MTLLRPLDVDAMLRYPRGRSVRLAKAGKIPHIVLPDGQIRFDPERLERFIREESAAGPAAQEAAHAK